jgi:hypothetical protein
MLQIHHFHLKFEGGVHPIAKVCWPLYILEYLWTDYNQSIPRLVTRTKPNIPFMTIIAYHCRKVHSSAIADIVKPDSN